MELADFTKRLRLAAALVLWCVRYDLDGVLITIRTAISKFSLQLAYSRLIVDSSPLTGTVKAQITGTSSGEALQIEEIPSLSRPHTPTSRMTAHAHTSEARAFPNTPCLERVGPNAYVASFILGHKLVIILSLLTWATSPEAIAFLKNLKLLVSNIDMIFSVGRIDDVITHLSGEKTMEDVVIGSPMLTTKEANKAEFTPCTVKGSMMRKTA
ncbi:hypothetical protein H0H81_005115 [Sphagnurus paluster]|uniref:Uncharacterized protein n=1 Tax=Sphagnurus paluster TaxID=117069 RepID=A0A9P7FUE0_9AGAR|nr:hypothetical protein H0H81_005115 [Sphagnurus paluster]